MCLLNIRKGRCFAANQNNIWNRMFSCAIETFECFINVGVSKSVVCFDNVLTSFFRDRMRKKATLFDMVCKFFEFHSAVRGYHHYKKYWQPIEHQTLDCMHKNNNSFQFFHKKSYRSCELNCGTSTNGEFSTYNVPPWPWNKKQCKSYTMQLLCFTSSTRTVRNSLLS